MREAWIREIEQEYETMRETNYQETQARMMEAVKKDARIGDLMAQRMRLFRGGAQAVLSNPPDGVVIGEEITRQVESIQQQLRAHLAAAGFPETYLQPTYHCARCRDTGYVGDLIRERCTCFEDKLRARLLQSVGYGLNPDQTFDTFDADVYDNVKILENGKDTQRSFMQRMRARCEAYADAFPATPQKNLLMFGLSGLGKTYLLNCIGNRVHLRGIEVMKVTSYQLSERMRAAVFENQSDGFEALLRAPLLLLDDLGAEPLYTNITVEQLFTLLNERQAKGLHTVISTNLHLEELRVRYTERVCSRLFDKGMTSLLHFQGSDVRLRL